jgi:D-alanyl-D-alanine carboxypeptidase
MGNTARAIVAAIALCVALAACTDSDETPPIVAAERVGYAAAVDRVMAQHHLPGAVVGVYVPGRPDWVLARGLADIEHRVPMSADLNFPIRSITKSVTVTAILQLVQDGTLGLDDPIAKYVPGIPNGTRITLAQLAGMESGVKNYTEVPAFIDALSKDFFRPWTAAEIVGYAIPASPVFEPGAQYDYSNTNTLLLGMVVEAVTHAPIVDSYRQRIWAPLGLTATSYPQTSGLPAPHPMPYEVDPATGATELLPLINLSSLGAAGGIVSTLADLRVWGEALATGRLISPGLQAQRMARARPATNGPEYDVYGLGMGRLKGWWGHSGDALGFHVAVFRDPVSGTVIAVLLNSSQPGNIATEMFKALADVPR